MLMFMLGVSFFWKIIPPVVVLGIFAFVYFSYLKEKASQVVIEIAQDTLDTKIEDVETQKVIASNLKQLNIYKGDRKEQFVAGVLGTPDYTTIIIDNRQLVLPILIQRLIQDGWTVERELEMSEYNGQNVHVVVSKWDKEAGDETPDIMVLDLKVEDYTLSMLKSMSEGIDLSTYAFNDKVQITHGVKICAGDCGVKCKMDLRIALQQAAESAKVEILHYYVARLDSIPINVYSPTAGGFIPDTISTVVTSPAVLELSYHIKRRKPGATSLSLESYQLKVDKFINVVINTIAPKDEEGKSLEGRRLNIALSGMASSGKSFLLRYLLQAGHKAGIQIIKASAGAFADFTKDPLALAALKSRAERGPTWLVIDEGNGLPPELVAALASTMEGLDSTPNLNVILATNREQDLTDSELSNLFREGRVHLLLDVCALPVAQWKPLLGKLKVENPKLKWGDFEPDDVSPKTLGQVYSLGALKDLEEVFQEMES